MLDRIIRYLSKRRYEQYKEKYIREYYETMKQNVIEDITIQTLDGVSIKKRDIDVLILYVNILGHDVEIIPRSFKRSSTFFTVHAVFEVISIIGELPMHYCSTYEEFREIYGELVWDLICKRHLIYDGSVELLPTTVTIS